MVMTCVNLALFIFLERKEKAEIQDVYGPLPDTGGDEVAGNKAE